MKGNSDSGMRKIFACKIRNLRKILLAKSRIMGFELESGIHRWESEIPLTIVIQNPLPLTETEIQYLKSGIHAVESRIQDYLGFTYMGRFHILIKRLIFGKRQIQEG